jgi:uncharacterized membrane protein
MTDSQGRHSMPKTMAVTLWAFALLAVAGLSWLVPAMQSPDEGSHIYRAYMISRGELLLQPIPEHLTEPIESAEVAAFIERARRNGGLSGGFIDKGLLAFSEGYMVLAGKADKRLSAAELGQLNQLAWQGTRRYYPLPGTGYYFPAVYAPQVVGLATGQLLELSIAQSYYLMRACTLLACFSMLWLGCRFLMPNPLVAAIVLLPMSLFQLVSPTIDGLTTSLAVLTVSLFMASVDRGSKHSAAASWGIAIGIFLLATSRTHLLPLLALPFYLAWQRQSRRDFYLGCLIAIATLAWILFALQTTNDPRIVRNQTTTQLLVQYAVNPAAFFQIVAASVADDALFNFYQRSFVGILGWLDTPLADNFYPALWTGLALCALASVSVSTLRKDWSARLLLVAIALASIGLVFLAMLATWTPHPAAVVKGVQGRYFVVPAILLAYAASGCTSRQLPVRLWIGGLALAGFSLTSVAALTVAVLGRYH